MNLKLTSHRIFAGADCEQIILDFDDDYHVAIPINVDAKRLASSLFRAAELILSEAEKRDRK
jgi:hypothetical protein